MSVVQEIETAIRQLTQVELAAFRRWFLDFDAVAWDRQLEADVAAGQLNHLAEEALRDLDAGLCKDL